MASFGLQTLLSTESRELNRKENLKHWSQFMSRTLAHHGGGHGRCAIQQTFVGMAHKCKGEAYDGEVRKSQFSLYVERDY